MSEPNETLLDEHLAAENAHDLERIMATYSASPVMELSGGARIEGALAVRDFHRGFGFARGDAAFEDVHVAERRRHRAGDAIILEQTLSGRHSGTWRGIAPTGRAFAIAVSTVYMFEGGRLAREHVYLDEGRLRDLLTRPEGDRPYVSSRDVILRTGRLAEAVSFYGTVLGLTKTLDQPGMVGYETGSFQLFVEEGREPHGPVFEMYVPDLEAAKASLCAVGCVVVEEDPRRPRCYVRDPFGLVFNLASTRRRGGP